uniref:tRNA-intron lyase n=1 Tax=Rodentolepis nana TaxID=102285 RepID=A0A0R3TU10_RODNA
MVSQLKSKLSRSSANLSEIGSKGRSKRSSPDGSRCDQDCRGSAISSKSKSGGVRRKISSVFSHFRHNRKSKDNPDGFQSCIDLRQLMPLNEPAVDETLPTRFQDSRQIARNCENALEPNTQYSGNSVKEEWGLPSTQPQPTSMTPAPNPKSNGSTAAYGLHPEEGPGKAKDDMTKRELIELTSILEQRLLTTRTELVRANMEQNQLSARVEELNSELTQTRLQLSTLRSRLLEDNLTQYLEVTIIEDSSVVPPPRNDHPTTFQSPNPNSPGPTPRSPENSFLSKAKAIATRSFGGGILSNATSQPNLSSTIFNGQNSFSSPSPPRNGFSVFASRKSLKRKLRSENDEEEDFIGPKKKFPIESEGGVNGATQRYSNYPLVRRRSNSGDRERLHVFTATLLRIESSPAQVAFIEVKWKSHLKEIAILQSMGCYGYSFENGGKIQPDSLPTKLFFFDSEIFFLYHELGVLRIAIPRSLITNPKEKRPINHLWDILTASNNLNLEQPLTPFPLRYAAYVYYRSRGWIVRPSLSLGGVDFLLYAESPDLRHAAFAVVVVPGLTNRSICDITAHLRVASSVAKKLIIAKVLPPENYQTELKPWKRIKDYSIEETLVSRPDIV